MTAAVSENTFTGYQRVTEAACNKEMCFFNISEIIWSYPAEQYLCLQLSLEPELSLELELNFFFHFTQDWIPQIIQKQFKSRI